MSKTEIGGIVAGVEHMEQLDMVSVATVRSNVFRFSAESGAHEMGDAVLITVETRFKG